MAGIEGGMERGGGEEGWEVAMEQVREGEVILVEVVGQASGRDSLQAWP